MELDINMYKIKTAHFFLLAFAVDTFCVEVCIMEKKTSSLEFLSVLQQRGSTIFHA